MTPSEFYALPNRERQKALMSIPVEDRVPFAMKLTRARTYERASGPPKEQSPYCAFDGCGRPRKPKVGGRSGLCYAHGKQWERNKAIVTIIERHRFVRSSGGASTCQQCGLTIKKGPSRGTYFIGGLFSKTLPLCEVRGHDGI